MRYPTVPDDTVLPTDAGPKPYAFTTFVQEFVLSDPRWRKEWGVGFDALAAKLVQAKPQGTIALTDEEHERASACAQAANIPPMLTMILMPHIHAITLAPAKCPGPEPAP